MFKKFLASLLTVSLCLVSSTAYASSSTDFSLKKNISTTNASENINFNELLNNSQAATGNKSDDLSNPLKVNNDGIKLGPALKSDLNKSLLNEFKKPSLSTNLLISESKTTAQSAVAVTTGSAVDVVGHKPIANLKYIILNPDSLKNGQVTINTQIAWLWSYKGENYTYDPDGGQITKLNVDGTPGVKESIIGALTGNIGFATQFKTPGQYIMTFKCMNDKNVWSDEWSITIPVEPADNNTRPQCVINYSTLNGNTDTQFVFGWFNSKDNDSNDSIKNVQGIAVKDGQTTSLSDYIISQDKDGCSLNFKDSGDYTLMFRVSDTHDAWSDWAIVPIKVTAAPSHSIQGVSINSNDPTGGGHNGIYNVAFVNSLLSQLGGHEDQIMYGARITRYGQLPQWDNSQGTWIYPDTHNDWLENLRNDNYLRSDVPDPNYTHTLIKDWMTVSGKITNSDGTTASNISVKITYNNPYITNESSRKLTAYAVTDSNGNYTYKFNTIPQSNGLQYETHGIGSSLLWASTLFLSPGTVTVSCGNNSATQMVMQFDTSTVNAYVLGTSEFVSGSYTDEHSFLHYTWEQVK